KGGREGDASAFLHFVGPQKAEMQKRPRPSAKGRNAEASPSVYKRQKCRSVPVRLCSGEEGEAVLAWRRERFARFDAGQRCAIRAFLEYARDEQSRYFTAESVRRIDDSIRSLWGVATSS